MENTEERKGNPGHIPGCADCIEGVVISPSGPPRLCYDRRKVEQRTRLSCGELMNESRYPDSFAPCFIRKCSSLERDTDRMPAVFRKFPEGDAIVFFPGTSGDCSDHRFCLTYQHTGQHCDGAIALMSRLDPADREEIEELKREYYNLYSTRLVDMEEDI